MVRYPGNLGFSGYFVFVRFVVFGVGDGEIGVRMMKRATGEIRAVVERLAELQALIALLERSGPDGAEGRIARVKERVRILEEALRRGGYDPSRLVRMYMRKRYDELVREYRLARREFLKNPADESLKKRVVWLGYKLDGFAVCLFGRVRTLGAHDAGAVDARYPSLRWRRFEDLGNGEAVNGVPFRRVVAPVGRGNAEGYEFELEPGIYAHALDVDLLLDQKKDNFLLYALYLLRYSSVEGDDGTAGERVDLKSGMRVIRGVGIDLEQRVALLRSELGRMYIFTVRGKRYLVDLDNAGVLHVIDERGYPLEDKGLLRRLRRYVLFLRMWGLG